MNAFDRIREICDTAEDAGEALQDITRICDETAVRWLMVRDSWCTAVDLLSTGGTKDDVVSSVIAALKPGSDSGIAENDETTYSSVTLYEVFGNRIDLAMDKLRDVWENEEDARVKAANEQKERAEYERLKARFEVNT